MGSLNDKRKICCFTGHRQIPPENKYKLRVSVEETINMLLDEGVSIYISGGALGFDLMAARAVLRAKEKHPQVQLIMAIPCRDQHVRWCLDDRREYEEILKNADEIYCLNDKYCTGCMHQRNRFMVEQSEICVAFYNGGSGGTAHTLGLANDLGLRVINLANQYDLACVIDQGDTKHYTKE